VFNRGFVFNQRFVFDQRFVFKRGFVLKQGHFAIHQGGRPVSRASVWTV